jgi:chromosome partitioning protein
MTRVLAISNRKGGVGKSTSVLNIGAALARTGHTVLLVDLDPQANLTQALGMEAAPHNINGALLGEYRPKAYETCAKNLVLLAGSPALSAIERTKGRETGSEFLLRELLAPFQTRCDFILLDCPPALDLITLNAYACAQQIFVPLEAQLFGLQGLELVLELVARVQQRLNPELEIGGAFFTRFDKRKILRRETAEQLRVKYPSLVLESVIRESIGLGEAPHLHQDIFTYAPASAGAADYQALTAEILTR